MQEPQVLELHSCLLKPSALIACWVYAASCNNKRWIRIWTFFTANECVLNRNKENKPNNTSIGVVTRASAGSMVGVARPFSS